ncbi:MAG: DUF1127 domain-containing protein [Pseudomonadota bacterium]
MLDFSETRGFVTDLVNRFKAWRAYRKTVTELSSLSDHELSDIGLHRSNIHAVARAANH